MVLDQAEKVGDPSISFQEMPVHHCEQPKRFTVQGPRSAMLKQLWVG